MQLRRLLANEALDYSVYYLPFIRIVLNGLVNRPLVVVVDGSVTGHGCVTLMVSVVYQRRALPLMWITRKGKKGHFPETIHVELIKAVQDILPQGREVTVLGDGEFDGTDWLDTINRHGWRYVCRTAKDSVFYEGEDDFKIKDICPERGGCTGIQGVSFTKRRYGSLMAVAWWGRKYQEPIYLVSNLTLPEEACQLYRKRFRIETLFSDFKGRGFQLQKSGLIDPVRVSRLLIAVSLAYVWVISLGVYTLKTGWNKIIHRTDRCDLSLFELGKRLLKRFSSNNIPLPPIDIFLIIKI